jgi:hypothetical protein
LSANTHNQIEMETSIDPIVQKLLTESDAELREKILGKLNHLCERIENPAEVIVTQLKKVAAKRIEVRCWCTQLRILSCPSEMK